MNFDNYLTAMAGIASLLLGGNVFFIKRLIDRLDTASNEIGQFSKLETRLQTLESSLCEMKHDVKALKRMEIDIAVMKNKFKDED